MKTLQTRKQFAERNKAVAAYHYSYLNRRYPSHPVLYPKGFGRNTFNIVAGPVNSGRTRVAVEMLVKMMRSKPYGHNKKLFGRSQLGQPTVVAFVDIREQFFLCFYLALTGECLPPGVITNDSKAMEVVNNFIKTCGYEIKVVETDIAPNLSDSLESMQNVVEEILRKNKSSVRIIFSDLPLSCAFNPKVRSEHISWFLEDAAFIGTTTTPRAVLNVESPFADNDPVNRLFLLASNVIGVKRDTLSEDNIIMVKALKARGATAGTLAKHNLGKPFWDFELTQDNSHV